MSKTAENRQTQNHEEKPTTTTFVGDSESISPLRQFILDLKKNNKRKEKEGASAKDTTEETQVPSWRKSARNGAFQNRQHAVDPLFSSQRRRGQSVMQDEQLQQGSYAELPVFASKATPPKLEKPKEVVLPLNDTTILELSKLFGVKVDKLLGTLREMGEDPKRDESYTVGKSRTTPLPLL
jgi:hypothetical protein